MPVRCTSLMTLSIKPAGTERQAHGVRACQVQYLLCMLLHADLALTLAMPAIKLQMLM